MTVSINGTALAWSNFNVERDEDRVRLANSAYTNINGQIPKEEYRKELLKKDLDLFCRGLWEEWIECLAPLELAGTAEPIPPAFALEPFVLEEGGTILFAPPGRGKSYLTLAMAVSIDAGCRQLWPVRQQKVLFINLERGVTGIQNRIGNVNAALGLPRTRPILTLNGRGRSLYDVLPAARKAMAASGATVACLDSISRAGMGDLTENNPVNRIVDAMNGLSPTWLGIGHTPRGDESHIYGGIHFEAGADIVVRVLSQQDSLAGPLGVGLKIVKENDIGKWPVQILAFEFERERGLVAIREAWPGEFPDVEGEQPMSMKEVVRQWLADPQIRRASATQAAKATGFSRQNVAALFKQDATFVELGRDGHSVVYGVRQ